MSIFQSGIWCDLCRKPIIDGPYWNCAVNGQPGHACDKCKDAYEKRKSEKEPNPQDAEASGE